MNTWQRAHHMANQHSVRMHGALYEPPRRWNWWHIAIGALLTIAAVAFLFGLGART